MKRLFMAVSVAGVMATPSVFGAYVGNVTLLDDASQYSYGNGGEFRAVGDSGLDALVNWGAYTANTSGTIGGSDTGSWGYNSGLAGQRYFQTFCIEYTEEFYPGQNYGVNLSYNALYGHVAASPGVPVTLGTAWLYSQFASGGLALYGYNYTYGSATRAPQAGALQQAIWAFQGEDGLTVGLLTGQAHTYADAAISAITSLGKVASSPADGAYGVYALNLGVPGQVQDQLVIAVPEPSSVLAGVCLLALPLGASVMRILRRNSQG